jgi:hypothetical protein
MKSFEAERGPHRATSWPQPLVDERNGRLRSRLLTAAAIAGGCLLSGAILWVLILG